MKWLFWGNVAGIIAGFSFVFSQAIAQVLPDIAVSLDGPGPYEVSPAIADVDGDSSNGLEVVFGLGDGSVRVHTAKGGLLWESTVPTYTCSQTGNGNKMKSSPAVGDLDGDGVPEVVIGYGGVDGGKCGGGVIAFRGTDGAQSWIFDTAKDTPGERFSAVYGTPALGDVNGDGNLEVIFGSHNRMIYALNYLGKKVFSYQAGDTVFASLALANIDSDPELEMIGGTDISRNDAMKIKDGGFLYAFDPPVFEKKILTSVSRRDCAKIKNPARRQKCWAKGKREPSESTSNGAYGFRDSKSFKWMIAFDQVMQSSPVVAELLPSSSGPEIVTGSGCFFPISSSHKNGAWVKVVGSVSGKVLRTFSTSTCMPSSPAVADLNGDGFNEVVVLVGGGGREVVAWTPATDTVLWRAEVGSSSIGLHGKQAIIADLDGNGSMEVSFGSGGLVIVLAGDSGEVLETLKVKGVISSNPVVGDLDSDGVIDLVAVGEQLAIFNSLPVIGSEEGPAVPGSVPFGSWRGNAMRAGVGN